MTKKEEIQSEVEELGASVKSIRKYGNTYKVKINWKDYPKVRDIDIKGVEFTF